MSPEKRTYRQDARAEKAEANGQDIVDSAVALVRAARRVADVTLDDIARQSGLTVRTILRRFGSREGVLEAAFAQLGREIETNRQATPAGGIEAGLDSLMNQYELSGDLNIRGLEEEDQLPLLHRLLTYGRAQHRAWLHHVFGPHLKSLSPAARERSITALYAATDVYLWKLMRRDLGLDKKRTAEVFRRLVYGVVSHPPKPSSKGGK